MNSMFRSFLKSMQTKSQDAQNPGLWVNGNRLPMHEQQAPTDAPYTKIIDTPEAKARREEDGRQKRELTNKTMKDLDDKEQNYRRAHPSYLRPVRSDPNEPKFIDPPNS